MRTMMASDARERLMAQAGRGWYRIDNQTGDGPARIYIYDVIDLFGVDAAQLVPEIAALNTDQIELHINSPGGNVFDAVAIYNALREHPARVESRIDGIAASAASYIAQAAETVVMAQHSMMMIHEPWGITLGDAEDHRKQSETLDRIGNTIASIYAERAGGSVDEWRDRMHEESWFDDQEAVAVGLADSVAGSNEAVENRFDLTMYQNVPPRLRGSPDNNDDDASKREVEEALREAGLSRSAAAALVAGGWDAMQRTPREAADERAILSVVQSMRTEWSR